MVWIWPTQISLSQSLFNFFETFEHSCGSLIDIGKTSPGCSELAIQAGRLLKSVYMLALVGRHAGCMNTFVRFTGELSLIRPMSFNKLIAS